LTGKGWRLLSTTSGLKRFVLGLWSDGDGSPFVLLFRADTVELTWTAAAIGGRELDFDHLVGSVVDGWRPTDTALSFGTGSLLVFPIDHKLAGINALRRIGLPLHCCLASVRMPLIVLRKANNSLCSA
jgi:hypothetical protein